MPEGDTLRKIADAMAPLMVGQPVVQARLVAPAPLLLGRRVQSVQAHGKHLFIEFSGDGRHPAGFTLRVHLGMFGTWHRYAPNERWRLPRGTASVQLTTADDVFVCFRAEDVELVDTGTASETGVYERLGPNLLAETCDMQDIVARARRYAAHSPLVDVLLNQTLAAGIGNVYKSEILFMHRWAPLTPLTALSDEAVAALFITARTLLQSNLGGWARTTTYDRRLGSKPGAPRVYVYGRVKQPCLRCETQIVRARLGRHRRGTYWCPVCQPAEGEPTKGHSNADEDDDEAARLSNGSR